MMQLLMILRIVYTFIEPYKILCLSYFFIIGFSKFIFANQIGIIDQIDGEIYYEDNQNNKNILVSEFEDVILGQKYFLKPNSQITLSLLDGSTINFIGGEFIEVKEYEDILSTNPHYLIEIKGGNFFIETGELPKINKNSSKILTELGLLILNGTSISADFISEVPEIFLLTDSFGEKGELLIETNSGNVLPVEADSGISISSEGEVSKKELNDQIIEKQNSFKKKIIESSIIDEEKIASIIEKKIQSGQLKDLDGDGIINEKDKEILTKSITQNKSSKLDTIIQNTKNDTALLGEIITNSSETQSSSMIEKMIDKKPEAVAKIAEKIIEEGGDKFSNIINKQPNLVDKFVETIVKNSSEFDTALSKIVAKTDPNLSEKIISNITETNTDLLTKVLKESAEIDSKNVDNIVKNNQELSNKITEVIVEKIVESADGTEELKDLITKGNTTISSKILEQVDQVDSSMTEIAIKESIEENKEQMITKLSEGINDNDLLSKKIVKESLRVGDSEMIVEAAKINQQKQELENNNNSQQSSNNNLITNEIDEDAIENQETLEIDSEVIENQESVEIELEPNIQDDSNSILNKFNTIIEEETKKLIEDNPNAKIEINNNLLKDLKNNLASPN